MIPRRGFLAGVLAPLFGRAGEPIEPPGKVEWRWVMVAVPGHNGFQCVKCNTSLMCATSTGTSRQGSYCTHCGTVYVRMERKRVRIEYDKVVKRVEIIE